MDELSRGLETITNSIATAITGIPAPIRKNFFKAFGQLCTAAVDIPVAWLESQSAEIRAISEARIKLIKKEGENFYEEVKVPAEYVTKASVKYASKIIKEQLNLDEITLNAAKNLAAEKSENQSDPTEINGDWLNEFESHARLKSSDDMKIIFGKILSGEIIQPGSFSIRTVKLISQLDNQAAKLFQKLCSLTISLKSYHLNDARVLTLHGKAGDNSLGKYGLPFDSLNVLQEYGLIISDYNSWRNYSPCIAHQDNEIGVPFIYLNKQFGFIPLNKQQYDKNLKLHGVALTKAGKELLSIIPIEEVKEYTLDLINFLKEKDLSIAEVEA